jgi:hypothetical protein
VWRIDIADFPASDIDDLSVCKNSRRTIGHVGDGEPKPAPSAIYDKKVDMR